LNGSVGLSLAAGLLGLMLEDMLPFRPLFPADKAYLTVNPVSLTMAEPGGHTLRLLREIRGQGEKLETRMKKLETRMDREFAEIRERFEAIGERFERVDERFNGIDLRLETITRALANEIMQGKYVVAGIDQRFTEIERRLAALEQGR
jgi:hypothetical protein